jgi:KaiC/GvpD/RAD55 family RecA-like ATPase
MTVDLFREIINNKFLLILMEEDAYLSKLEEIIKSVEKTKTKICYICLSKPYKDVTEDLKAKGFDVGDFFFIDVLSSHYRSQKATEDCLFVSSPNDLGGIREAVKKATRDEKCSVILFDTISTMLIYQQTWSVVRLTHDIVTDNLQENVKKLFIVLKGDSIPREESQRLVSDLAMFADKALDV